MAGSVSALQHARAMRLEKLNQVYSPEMWTTCGRHRLEPYCRHSRKEVEPLLWAPHDPSLIVVNPSCLASRTRGGLGSSHPDAFRHTMPTGQLTRRGRAAQDGNMLRLGRLPRDFAHTSLLGRTSFAFLATLGRPLVMPTVIRLPPPVRRRRLLGSGRRPQRFGQKPLRCRPLRDSRAAGVRRSASASHRHPETLGDSQASCSAFVVDRGLDSSRRQALAPRSSLPLGQLPCTVCDMVGH